MDMKHYTLSSFGEQLALPLPGIYPCLTWQLNVTLHQKQQQAKLVSVIREPSDHVEIARFALELSDWVGVRPLILDGCAEALRGLDYLGGTGRGV